MLSEPLPEGGGFIAGELPSSIYLQNGFHDPFDYGVSQEPIHDRGEKGSKPTIQISMSEQPIPKGPSFFVEVFCLGKEVQLGNIHAGRTDHIAKMTTETQINPFVNRRFSGPSESFCSWTCLLRSREEWGDPGDGADSHAGGTADTNIWIIFGPNFFQYWSPNWPQSSKLPKNPNTDNVKCQSSNVKSNLKPKCHKFLILNFDIHLTFGF